MAPFRGNRTAPCPWKRVQAAGIETPCAEREQPQIDWHHRQHSYMHQTTIFPCCPSLVV
jgi:hypothetical protein